MGRQKATRDDIKHFRYYAPFYQRGGGPREVKVILEGSHPPLPARTGNLPLIKTSDDAAHRQGGARGGQLRPNYAY